MQVIFHGTGHYPPGVPIGPACWPHHDLLVVTRGAVNLRVGRKVFALANGDAVIIPPGAKFSGEGIQADTAIWVMHYKDTLKPKKKIHHERVATGSFARGLLLEISQAYRSTPRLSSYLDALAATLLARLDALPSLPRLSDIEQSHLLPGGAEPKRVRDMAGTVGLSDSHYRSKFRKATGVSPREYLQDRKAEKARSLLQETRLPIKEIATLVGYGDVASFHRAFTKLSGCTPARFRRETPFPA